MPPGLILVSDLHNRAALFDVAFCFFIERAQAGLFCPFRRIV